MTPTEKQIAGNILIAERTGWKFNQSDETLDLYPNGYYVLNNDEDWSRPEDLKFHEDFHWLMDAYRFLGFYEAPTEIGKAWNNLVDILRSQAN